MTIGERIKKIRVFRKMTMDDLGGALGFEGKNMSVRISQYETGARIPGEDMILKLADALHCNYKCTAQLVHCHFTEYPYFLYSFTNCHSVVTSVYLSLMDC